jgi:hypothetical protein
MAWSPELIAALQAYGADETGHSGRTLLAHLVGTADRLRAWGNPDVVCHAGLFHSIYGTQAFRIVSVPLQRRAEIAAVIGPHAEQLAYLFCVCDRRGFAAGEPGEGVVVREHASGSTHDVSAADVGRLLEIEAANLLDQIPPRAVAAPRVEAMMQGFADRVRDRVSPGAREALEAWLQG